MGSVAADDGYGVCVGGRSFRDEGQRSAMQNHPWESSFGRERRRVVFGESSTVQGRSLLVGQDLVFACMPTNTLHCTFMSLFRVKCLARSCLMNRSGHLVRVK